MGDIHAYLDGIKTTPTYYWSVGRYTRAVGDYKSTKSGGSFRTETQQSSTDPAEYLVRVTCNGVEQLSFKMPTTGPTPPSDESVLSEIRRRA